MAIKYIVNYGVTFNLDSRSFNTEHEARKFINEHIFGDSRYCSLIKVEELDADFKYVNHYELENKKLRDKMFNSGIIKKEVK